MLINSLERFYWQITAFIKTTLFPVSAIKCLIAVLAITLGLKEWLLHGLRMMITIQCFANTNGLGLFCYHRRLRTICIEYLAITVAEKVLLS